MLEKMIRNGFGKEEDYNCAEKILYGANEAYGLGLDPKALKLVAGFGGGMCIGDKCGAVAAAVMVLGYCFTEGVAHASPRMQALVAEYQEAYSRRMGSTVCEPLKADHRTEADGCLDVIAEAAGLLDKMMAREHLDVKLLAMDMDDTLLREDLTISEEVRRKLAEAEEKGVMLVLASGRMPHAMHRYIEELGLDKQEGYAICTNGSFIIKTDTYETIHEQMLETGFALEVHKTVADMGLPIQVYIEDVIHVTIDNEHTDLDASLTGLKKALMENPEDFIRSHKVSKYVIPGDPEVLQEAQKKLKALYGDQANIFTSKPFFLEIMPKDADKGHALEKLAGILGIPREQTVAVGDAMNDIGMLAYAGLGVAMKNAEDKVKEAADLVLEWSNDEDGLARLVEGYIL